jgi:hypothetical protein
MASLLIPVQLRRARLPGFQQPCAALVLEPITLALDAGHGRVVEQPIETPIASRRPDRRNSGSGFRQWLTRGSSPAAIERSFTTSSPGSANRLLCA